MSTVNKYDTDLEPSIRFSLEVQNVRHLTLGEIISSDAFPPGQGEIKWRLNYRHLTFGGSNSLLTLYLMSSNTLNLYCRCDWSVQTKSKKIIKRSKNSIFRFTEFCRNVVLGYISTEHLCRDITVHIKVNVLPEELLNDKEDELNPPTSCLNKDELNPPTNCLNKDIGRFKDKDELKDLTLHVEGKKLKVHKFIVGARSPVLAAMLDKDKDCDELHIPDVDYDVMEQVIRYMYTDQVEDIKERAHQLYPAACRFALLGLKTLCEDSLLMTLNLADPWNTLELGHENAKDFEAQIIKVIATNNNNEYYNWETHDLDRFETRNPRLYLDVMCACESKELEEVVRDSYEEARSDLTGEQWAAVQPVYAEVILNTLTVTNAFRTLVIANGQPGDFKPQVIKFIKRILKEFTNSNEFDCLAMDHPQLYLDTACAITDDRIEDAARVIYPTACKSEWLGVKALCEDIFVESLTVESAVQTFLLTDGQPGSFKDRIVDFIKSHGAEVTASTGFKTLVFLHPQLFQEVSEAISDELDTSSGHAAG